ELTRKTIPAEILTNHADNFGKVPIIPWPCFSGQIDESWSNQCLAAKLSIKKEQNGTAVHLYDFAHLQLKLPGQEMYVTDLSSSITLSPQDAFLLFANICLATMNYVIYWYSINENNYHAKEIKQRFQAKYPIRDIITMANANYLVGLFCIDYTTYLLEQLDTNKIDPSRILKLSGPLVLAKLSRYSTKANEFVREKILDLVTNPSALTVNQKIVYFTLYQLAMFSGVSFELPSFSNEDKQLLDRLYLDLATPFPSRTGPLVDRNSVYQKYLGRNF
ncbi:MAG: hypothetical protein ACTSO7_18320, partial [Candidatus Heimdallarchaeota archaeon]